jgi:hypothetical protein
MNKVPSNDNNNEKVSELYVSLDNVDNADKNKLKDCLACKLTGTFGLFGISVYMFLNARKQKTQLNKTIINSLATGKLVSSYNQI